MEDKLIQLHNMLCAVETKGESTVIMADCLKFLGLMIREESEKSRSSAEQ